MIIWKTNFADARVVAPPPPSAVRALPFNPLAIAPQLRSTQLKVTDNEGQMNVVAIKAEKEMISRVLPAVLSFLFSASAGKLLIN